MNKKLLSLVAGASLLVPTLGFAVGLGSIRTYSHLNEKLKAEIPVLSVKERGKMTVSLASNAEFSQRGVQRSDMLNSLNFALVERGGRYYVDVSSKKQVAVPYLNFILQLSTPEGVVSREYAIFLDPVGNAQKKRSNKQSVNAAPYRSLKSTISKRNSRKQGLPAVKRTTPSPSLHSGVKVSNAKNSRYGPVRRGETLWSIASYTRPSESVSVRQMMAAIKRANPRTLSNGLPAGATLIIPAIQGYPPYAGGYAPMPTAAKNTRRTIKKKISKATVKPKSTKKTSQKAAQKAELAEGGKSKNEEVARPQISQEQELVQKLNDNEKNHESKLFQVSKNGDPAVAEETFAQQLADDGKKVAKASADVFDNAGNVVAEAGKGALATVNEGLKNTGDGIKNVTGAIADKAKVAADDAVAKTDELVDYANGAVNNAVDSTKEALTPNDTASVINTPEQATPQPIEFVNTEKAKAVTEAFGEVVEPTVKTQSQESGLMDTVIDSAPYVGGAALAGLTGLFLWNRRRKSKLTDVVPLTESDMAELMGEDDIDELHASDDDIDRIDDLTFNEATHSLESLTDETVDKDIEVVDSVKVDDGAGLVDDVFADLDEVVTDEAANQPVHLNDNFDILAEDDDVFSNLDDVIVNGVANKTHDVDLNPGQGGAEEDVFANLNGVTDIDLSSDDSLPFHLDETINNKVGGSKELDDDSGLAFDFDDEKSEDLFKPIDLEGADQDFDVSEDLNFDLTDGDDLDGLLALDESAMGVTVDNADGGLDFSLEEVEDNVVEKLDDLKQATTDKVDDISLSLSDKADDVKEAASEKAKGLGLSLSTDETHVDDMLTVEKVDADLPLSDFDDEVKASAVDAVNLVSPEAVSRMRMKMDLANSFISIGEDNRAKELLSEIIEGGSEEQIVKARELLSNLG